MTVCYVIMVIFITMSWESVGKTPVSALKKFIAGTPSDLRKDDDGELSGSGDSEKT